MKKLVDKPMFKLCITILLALLSAYKITQGLHWDETLSIAVGDMTAKGSSFLTENWSPLQFTSVFISPLILIYQAIFGSSEGIILYFRIIYVIVHALVSYLAYRTLRRILPSWIAFIASVTYFCFTPHFMSITYKSLSNWFVMLMVLSLVNFMKRNKSIYLVLASVFLCLGTLAYPTLGILYFTTLIILRKQGKKTYCYSPLHV